MFSVGFLRASAILGVSLLAGWAPVAYGAIPFDVGGLESTSVAGQVKFSYAGATHSNSALNITIESISPAGRPGGFAFNVPTINGAIRTSAGGSLNYSGTLNRASPFSNGSLEISSLSADNRKGVIPGEKSSGARMTDVRTGEAWTKLRLDGMGSGLRTLSDSKLAQTFMNESSADAGSYGFGVRYQAIGTNGLSDFAVPATTTNAVPVPGAAVLAAIGLGIVGVIHRKNSSR